MGMQNDGGMGILRLTQVLFGSLIFGGIICVLMYTMWTSNAESQAAMATAQQGYQQLAKQSTQAAGNYQGQIASAQATAVWAEKLAQHNYEQANTVVGVAATQMAQGKQDERALATANAQIADLQRQIAMVERTPVPGGYGGQPPSVVPSATPALKAGWSPLANIDLNTFLEKVSPDMVGLMLIIFSLTGMASLGLLVAYTRTHPRP